MEQWFYRKFHLNITLWFTIYSFHVETVTIHFLLPNSTKNHQKCIIWSIVVPARITSNRRWNTSTQISKITIIVISSHCGCGCNRHVQRNILAQEPSPNSTVLLRYGLKTRMKVFESCTIFTTETWQNIYFALPWSLKSWISRDLLNHFLPNKNH